ncbi:hypothetical protein Tco_0769954, partial [Tanacetum coccineum]
YKGLKTKQKRYEVLFIRGGRYEVARNVRWQYEVAVAGQSEHDTCHSACVSTRKCGVNLLLGTCLNCTYGDGKPVTCCGCEGPLRGGFCSFCASRDGNSFDYNPNPNSFNESQNFSDYPPQPRYETNFCELCGNDAHFGYDCPTQVPFNSNPDPCYNQNFDNNFPLTSPSFPQQNLCCENCGDPHATFQCQPMNQDFYKSNPSGFDQFQPPQFPVNYPPQETNKEILQAREDLMEAIQAFLKDYDHIPPNEKCMALLLAEKRFLTIKQTIEEEKSTREEGDGSSKFIHIGIFSNDYDEKSKRQLFERHALTDKQYQQEDIQELMSKLLEDVRNISEELSEYINCPSWNRPIFYDNDDDEYTIIYSKPKAITPDLPIEEPDNSLSMGDEHLSTIPETESDELIKSSVENLVPIPMSSRVFPKIRVMCPFVKILPLDAFERSSRFIRSKTMMVLQESDDDDFETSDVILREKLLNINRLIANIESLNDNSTPNCVLKSTSPFPIPDSNSFFEKSDTSLSYSDNSLPEFESFSDHTEETSSGSTTTHANNSLPEYDSFHFEIEPDQGELTNVVMGEPRVHVPNVLPTHPTLLIDSDLIIRTFLPYFTYPVISYCLFSSGNEDTIFDPDISTFHFSSSKRAHEKSG